MSTPAPLSIEARRAAWDRLWRVLLAPPAAEPPDPPNGKAAGGEPAAKEGR